MKTKTKMNTTNPEPEHVCVKQAVCFECFRAGLERARARREAWAQRELPFDAAAEPLTSRAIAHRRQMLDHLSRLARQA
jgi:hypothetical protein